MVTPLLPGRASRFDAPSRIEGARPFVARPRDACFAIEIKTWTGVSHTRSSGALDLASVEELCASTDYRVEVGRSGDTVISDGVVWGGPRGRLLLLHLNLPTRFDLHPSKSACIPPTPS